jgi:hypothetical protein
MKDFLKKLYVFKDFLKKIDDAFMAHHKTVREFKKDIRNVPYYDIELFFAVIWMVTGLIASCSITELFGLGSLICSWGSDFVAIVKYIAFFTYLGQFYLEYRRFVFIYTTEKYSKNMKIYMFIRQILGNIFAFTAMVIVLNSNLEDYSKEILDNLIRKIQYRPDKFCLDHNKIELWQKIAKKARRRYNIYQRLRIKREKEMIYAWRKREILKWVHEQNKKR